MTNVFILLVLFQLKHFLADYPLQLPFMLQKFKADWGFFWPLVTHCGVHAFFTSIIVAVFCPEKAALCSVLDFVVHFAMDRIKAGPKYLGRFKPLSPGEFKFHVATVLTSGSEFEEDGKVNLSKSAMRGNTYFWWSLGLDQMVHHLTNYFIIWMVVSS